MGDRACTPRRSCQQGEEAPAGLHSRGRLRHHRALPPLPRAAHPWGGVPAVPQRAPRLRPDKGGRGAPQARHRVRSEEHTSELQSQSNLVCRLLLEKKKKKKKQIKKTKKKK